MKYFLALIITFLLSAVLSIIVKKLAIRFDILDYPREERKIHKQPIPLLGGLAIFLAFSIVVIFYSQDILTSHILAKHLWGIVLGGGILMLGGILDDKYNLRPRYQIIWPISAALAVIIVGLGMKDITNPFGGIINLNTVSWNIFSWQGLPYKISLPADILTFIWLMGMMYTTKFLDGLDGLATGISAIAAFLIFLLSIVTVYFLPEVALVAIIFVGACLGFLLFNFNPAKIFLGEGGSLFLGFMIGVLAIMAGSKIATTLLVMGIPILDVLWVIGRRIFWEKRAPFTADKKHLHYRFLEAGFSERRTVLTLYTISAAFGLLTLFLQSEGKFLALGVMIILMIIIAIALVRANNYKKRPTI